MALENYVLPDQKQQARAEDAARLRPLFGLILSTLYELDVTTDTAISEWYEDADTAVRAVERGDAATRPCHPLLESLLRERWTTWLLEKLDEDEDEEDDDDEEEEGDDEEDDEGGDDDDEEDD